LKLHAQVSSSDANKWYVPSHVRLQFAGNIGMLSAGPAWSLFRERWVFSHTFGYVPGFSSGKGIFITATKVIFTPRLDLNMGEITFKPLSLGFITSYTFGDSYNKYRDRQTYPSDYYWWDPSLRTGLLYETGIYAKLDRKYLKGLGLFLEITFWDLYLVTKFSNTNKSYLNMRDIATFGIGTKLLM